jgi:hypothetical protein
VKRESKGKAQTPKGKYNSLQSFRQKLINFTEMDYYAMKTLDPLFNGAVFHYDSIVLYMNSINHQNFTLKILNEALITNLIVFYLSKNFYLVDEIDEKISQFKANGFIKFWTSKYINSKLKKEKHLQSPLSLKQLKGTFEILYFGLLLSSFSFVIENKKIVLKYIFKLTVKLRS